MGLHRRFNRLSEEASAKTDVVAEMILSINQCKVIPIISNSFRIEQIFRDEGKDTGAPEYTDEDQTVNEQLTRAWATAIDYPLEDNHNLARVVTPARKNIQTLKRISLK